jgi:hypothetical protein
MIISETADGDPLPLLLLAVPAGERPTVVQFTFPDPAQLVGHGVEKESRTGAEVSGTK